MQTVAELCGDRVIIWSNKHNRWWCPDARGYMSDIQQAGVYERAHALELTRPGYQGRLIALSELVAAPSRPRGAR